MKLRLSHGNMWYFLEKPMKNVSNLFKITENISFDVKMMHQSLFLCVYKLNSRSQNCPYLFQHFSFPVTNEWDTVCQLLICLNFMHTRKKNSTYTNSKVWSVLTTWNDAFFDKQKTISISFYGTAVCILFLFFCGCLSTHKYVFMGPHKTNANTNWKIKANPKQRKIMHIFQDKMLQIK